MLGCLVWSQGCPASSPDIFSYAKCVSEIESLALDSQGTSLKDAGAPFGPLSVPESRCHQPPDKEAVTKWSL